jgi:hypothetical protein
MPDDIKNRRVLRVMQTRSTEVLDRCSSRYRNLLTHCTDIFWATHTDHSRQKSFGIDPAFNPSSSLFKTSVVENEDQFYNTTPGSGDLSETKFPFAFFSQPIRWWTGFHVTLPVRSHESLVLPGVAFEPHPGWAELLHVLWSLQVLLLRLTAS